MTPPVSPLMPSTTRGVNSPSSHAKVDLQAIEVCSDSEVSDAELTDQLMPLVAASGVADTLALRWWYRHRSKGAEREDLASGMFLELIDHLRAVDRKRIANGASFCGWLYRWGASASHKVERQVTSTISRSAIPIRRLVSLEALADQARGDAWNLAMVRRLAPPRSNAAPDLVDPDDVRASLARRRGAGRQEVVSRVVHDALGDIPVLLRPEDPAETQLVRRLIVRCPRLARMSLDAFCTRVDDGELDDRLAPEAMIAMWDATTTVERQRLAAMPDRLLALLVEDAVRLKPRPKAAVRQAVRKALTSVAKQAPACLLDDLVQAFWDEVTEAVSDHRTDITAVERKRMHDQAELNARRLPALVAALVRVPDQEAGRDVEEVRSFLHWAWAAREAASSRRNPHHVPSAHREDGSVQEMT